MLLNVSISKTKKFFQKTLKGFKSFLSRGGDHYQRLPKSPPFTPFSHMNLSESYAGELDKFYTDFTGRWDEEIKMGKKREQKKKEKEKIISRQIENFTKSSCERNFDDQVERRREDGDKSILLHKEKREDHKVTSCYNGRAEISDTLAKNTTRKKGERIRGCLVGKKLKEMYMVDKGNIEHVLDIEEVLHYYSRLTCPAYLDIVDKFFMENIYAEI